MKSSSVEKTVVERAKDFFARVVVAESEQRILEQEDISFANLDQWPAELKTLRENDPQGKRPCMVVDKVGQYKQQIVNSIRENRPSIKVRPVDDNADIETADIFEGLVRHIQDTSKADIAYDWAAECAVTSGLGYFRILTEFIDDTFQQQIRIARIRNRFSVYFDPNSKEPDGSDAKQCLIVDTMPRDDFIAAYPECDPSNWLTATGDNHWFDQDTVRIAEYFYIENNKEELLLLDDGNSVFASDYKTKYKSIKPVTNDYSAPVAAAESPETNVDPPMAGIPPPVDANTDPTAQPLDMLNLGEEQTETAPDDEMAETTPKIIDRRMGNRIVVKWCKLAGGETKPLKETTFPGKFIPVIPVLGIETDIDGKRKLRGIIRGVKDAQRIYNYQRSIMTESLGLTVKAPFIGAVGQFKTQGAKWDAANNVNFSRLEYDPVTINGNLAPMPQRQGFAGVPTGLIQDMQTSEHDIQAALGMYQASIGQDGNAKSGIAMNSQQKAGDLATFQFPDNLSKSVRHCGRILIDIIPIVMDKAQVIRTLGEDGAHSAVSIDPQQSQSKVKRRTKDGVESIFNLGVGKYDVTSTVGASFATKRMEGADFMSQVAQSNPDLMPLIGDLMFKAMDMPYADEVAKRLKIMLPPPIQQAIQAEDEGQSPEVQAVKNQAQQIISQLQQQLESAHQAMQAADQEHQQVSSGEASKAADSQAKMQGESTRAAAEVEKSKAEAAKMAELEQTKRYDTLLKVASDIVVKAMSFPVDQQHDVAQVGVNAIAPITDDPDRLTSMVQELLTTGQDAQYKIKPSPSINAAPEKDSEILNKIIAAFTAPRKMDLEYDLHGNVVGGISHVAGNNSIN